MAIIEGIICLAISKELMLSKVTDVAKNFNVSESLLWYMVSNESARGPDGSFLPCVDGDTHLIDPNGTPHRSRGILQINEFFHPNVSDREAYNVMFSLEWTATKIRDGMCHLWTTCRNYKNKRSTP